MMIDFRMQMYGLE